MPDTKRNTAGVARLSLKAALVLLLIVAAVRPLVSTIEDPDFFWHLQTGGWIREHNALPQEFLFSLTASETMTGDQRVTMTSYWPVQVLYNVLYSFGGLTAIALLRVALMVLLIGSLVLRSAGRDAAVFLGATLLGVILMRIFPFERPQIFSFIFFSLLLLVLDHLKNAPADAAAFRRALFAPPLLMIVWANCHGAFIVGQGVLLLYLAAEGLKFVRPALGPLPWRRYRLLLGACTAGILAAFVNPNTYQVYLAARLPAWSKAGNIDYDSTVAFFRNTGSPVMLVYWLLLALALLSFVLPGKKPDITRLALVAGTGIISFAEIRHIPFFMLSAVPAIAESFSRDGAWGKAGRALLLAAAITSGLCLLPGDLESIKEYRRANVVNTVDYPEDAADFIMSKDLKGNLYNWWPWGGYLMWRLSPAKVFSDGRNSSYEVFRMNEAVESGNSASPAGEPPWKDIFRKYGIRYAVLPVFNPKVGYVMELLFALGTSPDWVPVFIGYNSVVFVEVGADSRWSLPRSPAAREAFFTDLVRRCDYLIRLFPDYPFPLVARGDLLFRLRRHDEARAAYQAAQRLLPLNQLVRDRIAALPPAERHPRR